MDAMRGYAFGIVVLAAWLVGACAPAASGPAAPAAAPPAAPAAEAKPAPAITGAAASGGGAAASPARVVAEPVNPRQVVRVADTGLAAQGPTYIAVERGYFDALGLDIEMVPGITADMVALLNSGQLDVGIAAISPAFYNAVARGVGMRMVADHGTLYPGRATPSFVIRTDILEQRPWTGFADMKGMKIGTNQAGSLGDYWRDLMLQRGGLQPGDIETIQLPYPEMAVALANKAIDAAADNEPWATQQEQQGIIKKIMYMDEIDPGGHVAGLNYGEAFAKNTPAARNFMVAYLKGVRDYWDAYDGRQDFQLIVDVLRKWTPVKDEALLRKIPPTGQNPAGYLDPVKLSFYQDWFAEQGQQPQKADIQKAYDPSFADYANSVLGPYEPVANPRRPG
jgi:NitT/TauT family transport system substrate-binding protein